MLTVIVAYITSLTANDNVWVFHNQQDFCSTRRKKRCYFTQDHIALHIYLAACSLPSTFNSTFRAQSSRSSKRGQRVAFRQQHEINMILANDPRLTLRIITQQVVKKSTALHTNRVTSRLVKKQFGLFGVQIKRKKFTLLVGFCFNCRKREISGCFYFIAYRSIVLFRGFWVGD